MTNIDTNSSCITIAGDWHGNLSQALNVANHSFQNNCEVILQVGDFGIWEDDTPFLDTLQERLVDNGQRLYFVDGNHENFPLLYSYPIDPETGLRPIRDNIFHLPRGLRFTIHGIRFLALGGAYSVDRRWRKADKTFWYEEEVTDYDIEVALSPEDPTTDILLMHDSPFPAPNPITDNPIREAAGMRLFGYEAIQAANRHRAFLAPVLTETKPHVLVHGHYHEFWVGQYVHPSGMLTRVVGLDEGSAPMTEHAIKIDLDALKKELDEKQAGIPGRDS